MKRGEAVAGAAKDGADALDGRRLRSSRSRSQIVRAMHALIRDGDVSPSAARVAESAGVSLRTVFRHFEDMDALYREMSAIVEAEVMPILQTPLGGATWRARLDELLARRMQIFERIMPHKVAGSLRRFSSAYLQDDYAAFLRMERRALLEVLPSALTMDARLFGALEMTTGFEAWRRLRQDQKLSEKEARDVMMFAVGRLIAGR